MTYVIEIYTPNRLALSTRHSASEKELLTMKNFRDLKVWEKATC